ncbi:MAG: DUF3047 domain-containing protein [Methylobacter sp.]|jgi:hypothetical protein
MNVIDFKLRFTDLLGNVAEDVIYEHRFFELPSDQKPWFDTGLDVEAGDSLTSFAAGKTRFKDLPITLEPNFQLWFRIGQDGEIFRGTRDSHSFTAEQSGRLYLASYFPGEWADKTGELATPDEVYDMVTGNLALLLIRWQGDTLDGLKCLANHGDVNNLIAMEIDRLVSPVITPQGWDYLWFAGPAEIYQSCTVPAKTSAICCHTHNDVGLLQKTVSLSLKPNTRLRLSWKMDVLPSSVREDTLPTHDYLSIAVEFDNGQDITYYWSAELPPETSYRCPIPTWTARETHVVIRSGPQGLGEWLNEERDIYQDYINAIGGTMPGNIVKVWLIALSLFQHKEGACQYADISFLANGQEIEVL